MKKWLFWLSLWKAYGQERGEMAEGELGLKKQESKWQWWEVLDREDKDRSKVLKSWKQWKSSNINKGKIEKEEVNIDHLIKITSFHSGAAGLKYPDPDRADTPTIPKRPTLQSLVKLLAWLALKARFTWAGMVPSHYHWLPLLHLSPVCSWSRGETVSWDSEELKICNLCSLFLLPDVSKYAMQLGLHS